MKTRYNWNELPEWANFAATDFNGDICVSELKPQIVSGFLWWIPRSGDDERYGYFKNIGETPDWKNSLEERPKNQDA